jgi:hypothetical protein
MTRTSVPPLTGAPLHQSRRVQRVGASAVVSLQRAPAPSAACLGRQGGRSRTIAETRGIKLQAKAARVALLPLIQNGRPCDLGTGRLRGHRPGDGGGWPEARRTRQQRVGMKFNLTAIVSRSKPSPIPETTSGPRRTPPAPSHRKTSNQYAAAVAAPKPPKRQLRVNSTRWTSISTSLR